MFSCLLHEKVSPAGGCWMHRSRLLMNIVLLQFVAEQRSPPIYVKFHFGKLAAIQRLASAAAVATQVTTTPSQVTFISSDNRHPKIVSQISSESFDHDLHHSNRIDERAC